MNKELIRSGEIHVTLFDEDDVSGAGSTLDFR
jgi:hypothetical protein